MMVIDAMNVIGSRPDGWWRDRPGACLRLIDELTERGIEAIVVFDGRPLEGLGAGTHGRLTVMYADRAGPDAADDRIAAHEPSG